MQNHPIPQDIASFRFKLIGDMTIKQFVYLAAGIILAWITFSLSLPGIIKAPIAVMLCIVGISLAFFSAEGRPLDLMLLNFIKAIFKPTQFVYQNGQSPVKPTSETINMPPKTVTPPESPIGQMSMSKPLNLTLNKEPKPALLSKNQSLTTNSIKDYQQIQPKTANEQPHIISFNPTRPINSKTAAEPEIFPTPQLQLKPSGVNKTAQIQNTIGTIAPDGDKPKNIQPENKNNDQEQTYQKLFQLEQLLNQAVDKNQKLETQLMMLQNQMTAGAATTFTPTVKSAPTVKPTLNTRQVPASMGKSVGLPIAPEFPNIITGIVKDSRGNPLGNILVEVKDDKGNSARAFKTNTIGQFASATPLPNGDYRIEFEDPKNQHKFDAVQFSVSGKIILPLEVISVDTREELRKSLFN